VGEFLIDDRTTGGDDRRHEMGFFPEMAAAKVDGTKGSGVWGGEGSGGHLCCNALGGILAIAFAGWSDGCGGAVSRVEPGSRVSLMATWQTAVCVAVVERTTTGRCMRRTCR
jgi:hypothetical protein